MSITPISLNHLPFFNRPHDKTQSTDFAFSRFLTPYLAGFEGQAIFMDCDMIVRCDIVELLEFADKDHDVFVVKHDYTPKTTTKFLGAKQHNYPRKNWSSVMVFNCGTEACRKLTPGVVETQTGKYLHRFEWTTDDRIGELPPEYNHLVGEYDENPDARIVHFTLGTPCFQAYQQQEYADEWRLAKEAMLHADQ